MIRPCCGTPDDRRSPSPHAADCRYVDPPAVHYGPRPIAYSAGELAHPGWAYYGADNRPLMGPCDTPGCPYASKPGGFRHDGACDPR